MEQISFQLNFVLKNYYINIFIIMQGIYDICKEKISVATKEKITHESQRLHKVDHNCQELDEEYGIFRILKMEMDTRLIQS